MKNVQAAALLACALAGVAALLDRGVFGVPGYLKTCPSSPTRVANPVWIERTISVTAELEGVLHARVDRDAHVVKSNLLGTVCDHWGAKISEVYAPEDGIVPFLRALPSLRKGDTIASIGVVKK